MQQAPKTGAGTIRLGLIGDNIARSQAPRLHELAGRLTGLDVRYDRLTPREFGKDFEPLFAEAATSYRGLNITYPYKERVVPLVTVPDPRVAALGAVNTVVFEPDGPKGYNTDHSGFVAAYARTFGDRPPGTVCMLGAGGVGKAVAFGLLSLGLTDLRLVDPDLPKAAALARSLQAASPGLSVTVTGDVEEAATAAVGLVNCTPVGMVGYGGTPLPRRLMRGGTWAFDAVYTPVDTEFLRDAAAEGLAVMSGYELYFYQGLHAYAIFHGREIDEAVLRRALQDPP
jgi:shikimate dehydrogenase